MPPGDDLAYTETDLQRAQSLVRDRTITERFEVTVDAVVVHDAGVAEQPELMSCVLVGLRNPRPDCLSLGQELKADSLPLIL